MKLFNLKRLGALALIALTSLGWTHGVELPAPSPIGFSLQVNLSGADYGTPEYPTPAEIDYYASKNLKTVRLTFSWEKMQPTLGGTIDPTYLANIKSIVNYAQTKSVRVLLDCHNFGRYGINAIGAAGGPTIAQFTSLWTQMASAFVGSTNVIGYELMNEPHDMPIAVADMYQPTITAIRGIDTTTPIYIDGDGWSSAYHWPTYNNSLYTLSDPNNLLIFTGHAYPDRDASGSHFDWPTEVAAGDQLDLSCGGSPCPLDTNILVKRLTVFANWCSAHGVHCHAGEVGIPDSNPNWLTTGDNALAYLQGQGIPIAIWAGGPAWGAYPMGLDPGRWLSGYPGAAPISDNTQMALLTKYSGGAQPTQYFLTGPQYGSNGSASGNFTVAYMGTLPTVRTITPHAALTDGTSAGGTFSPASITLAANTFNPTATFTYTAATSATIVISTTNSASLTDPPVIGYSTIADDFVGLAGQPAPVFDLRRRFTPYIGPEITLQRVSDGASQTFSFNAAGNLPRQTIQDWAGSRLIPVTQFYDQSNAGGIETFSGSPVYLNLKNSAGYPEILVNGASFGEANFASYGLTQMSIVARLNKAAGSANNTFIRQDWFVGPFNFDASAFFIGDNTTSVPNLTVANTQDLGVYHTYAGTAVSNTVNGMKTFRDGSLVNQATTAAFTFNPAFQAAQFENFNFKFSPLPWHGSYTSEIFGSAAWTPTQIAAFSTDDASYYSTPLPDTLSAVAPEVIAAAPTSTVTTTNPFSHVTIQDTNSGTPTDSITLTLTGTAGGTLSGTGLSGTGPYTIASASAASLTTTMHGVSFTTSGAAGQTETISVQVTSSAGTSITDTRTVITVNAPAVSETSYPAPSGTFTPVSSKGVNIAAAEGGYPSPNQYNYLYPQNMEIDYFAGQGFGMIRMPVSFRRLQPVSYGPLDPAAVVRNQTNCPNLGSGADGLVGRCDEPAEASAAVVGSQTNLTEIKRVLDHAFSKNMYVLIDPHEYGYITDTFTGTARLIGADAEGTKQFVDWWERIATKFKNYPNVRFGLINEPHDQTAAQWYTGATAAINGIASVTTAQLVTIPGTYYTSAYHWALDSGNNTAWAGYTPPAGLSIAFEMHNYLDSDQSGTHAACVTGVGSSSLTGATSWARTNGFKIILGEVGWSRQDPSCPPEATTFMSYMTSNSDVWMGWTYWVCGSNAFYGVFNASGAYIYSVVPAGYPSGPFTNAPQMTILKANQ